MSSSVMSFPERGKWGKSSWRGNCSGYVYKALFEQYKASVKSFCDPMMGSGTSIEVAKEMGIDAYGLDLHMGFNALKHSIRDTIGQEVDMCLSHPPYGEMIIYSAGVWGGENDAHPDDLSRCIDDEDFHEKLHLVLLNQREATKPGGIYGSIIGDMRKNGKYVSYQAEAISRMPASELTSVIIKTQHNTMSDKNTYSNFKHFSIMHEYLFDLSAMANQQAKRLHAVWKNIVAHAMMSLGGKASLSDLYQKIAQNAPEKLKGNEENWQAKVRQTLQRYTSFSSVERGVWALA